MTYEEHIRKELLHWRKKMLKTPGLLEKGSKAIQGKINNLYPQKFLDALTGTIKRLVRGVLFGLEYIPKGKPLKTWI